ncbi:MAG: sugar phosphate isomerase/epimerase [Anaerolineae bacterium]|nr:sugar phosphate isomerase/epimerase [Anaerolineae bacterium]
MKTCVSTYSFTKAVRSGELAYLDIPAKAAEMGYASIELATAGIPDAFTIQDLAPKFKDRCDQAGLPIINYTIGADFIMDDSVEAQVKTLVEELQIAKLLGVSGMRHDAARGPRPERGIRTYDDALPIIAEGCRAVTVEAEKLGIRTMIENHGYFAQDSHRVEKLVTAVGHPNFGLLIDIGNFMCADELSELAVSLVAPLAAHVHVKDFLFREASLPVNGQGWFPTRAGNLLRGTVLGHGVVRVKQCIDILKKAGYGGAVSVEFEGVEECLQALAWSLENLERYLACGE